ncbi:efflux RND transporter periplasmic adaptor subunit [Biostraticola tofi]|uniref:Macrolide-specific efflux system membrane fusion protein n=1 Tax=Biostraticola tofi TaxID=466109 RepID=A0A4R3YGD8_9GAMM|nr:efflux RND transporter periplasmic adaptor subunit [Biostraticola tofi]TCV91210.1 macrolide-specific efflux system membrane fusion protein [Biostraticola tofi]
MQFSQRRQLVIVLMAMIFIVIALVLYFWQRPAPVIYSTVPVRKGDIENVVLAAGKLDALERVNVGAQVSGQVKSLKIKVGDRVHNGQLIAEIDDLPQRNDLRNAEAALNVAYAQQLAKQAALKQAQAEFRRQKRMLSDEASSQQDYDSAEATLATTRADLLALQAQIVQAQIEVDNKKVALSYTKILAPMDGTVIAIITQQGQTVNANQIAPTIAKLARLDVMQIKAQISEADITHVTVGQQAYFTIFSEPGKRYNATLRSIELAPESVMRDDALSAGQSSSGSDNPSVYYNALLDVPNADNTFRIAMTAQVSLLRAEGRDTLLIPRQAIITRPGGPQAVLVLGPDNTPQTRTITTGISNSTDIQVLTGLTPGERIVLSPASGQAAPAW